METSLGKEQRGFNGMFKSYYVVWKPKHGNGGDGSGCV